MSSKKKGQGLVEFALILPVLLLLLMGIIEFAYVFASYSGLFNAAREGTRYGAVYGRDPGGAVKVARSKIFIVNSFAPNINVCCDSGPGTETFQCNPAVITETSWICTYQTRSAAMQEGTGVVMISSDLPELIGICDRILVFHEGQITGEVLRDEFSEELIMAYAAGIKNHLQH